jgi:YgiT-type zinc finger domain-containing protein
MYGYKCAYCDGIGREQIVKREAFKHRNGFVILEDVPIGVCDACGSRYYHSTLLHRVEEIATGARAAQRTQRVPVALFV